MLLLSVQCCCTINKLLTFRCDAHFRGIYFSFQFYTTYHIGNCLELCWLIYVSVLHTKCTNALTVNAVETTDILVLPLIRLDNFSAESNSKFYQNPFNNLGNETDRHASSITPSLRAFPCWSIHKTSYRWHLGREKHRQWNVSILTSSLGYDGPPRCVKQKHITSFHPNLIECVIIDHG